MILLIRNRLYLLFWILVSTDCKICIYFYVYVNQYNWAFTADTGKDMVCRECSSTSFPACLYWRTCGCRSGRGSLLQREPTRIGNGLDHSHSSTRAQFTDQRERKRWVGLCFFFKIYLANTDWTEHWKKKWKKNEKHPRACCVCMWSRDVSRDPLFTCGSFNSNQILNSFKKTPRTRFCVATFNKDVFGIRF